ncbi:MAG: DUF927 domain-containing protein [Gammaproteobacteria bacterium]|nr:DUF927 domain-containing protein [Gammaproteobacteria bacterium]
MTRWPERKEDYLALAQTLCDLVGGRSDVAARHHDFTDDAGNRHVGWGPWKGSKVAPDYAAKPGELVKPFKIPKGGGIETRLLKPLSAENVVRHLRGKDRLGVYVLDPDCRVKFLAADFDDHSGKLNPDEVWQEVKKFWDTCDTWDFKAHIERSKSGSGYHVWVFFDSRVSAGDVRSVGRWLFEESQTLRDDDDFSTFDRFFPAQATLPKSAKGYGNLIGLPLFGYGEVSQGKTAWVDPESGATLGDQWGFTLSILENGRNTAAQVSEFMVEHELEPDTGNAPEREYEARTGEEPLEPAEGFEEIKARCNFVTWVVDENNWPKDWPDVSEPLWFAWLTNIARFDSAREWAHKYNSWHPKYSEHETNRKFDHAQTSGAPQSCRLIQEEGFKRCPKGGCKLPNGNPTKSPAGLAVWARKGKKKKHSRSVKVEPVRSNVVEFPNGAPNNRADEPPPFGASEPVNNPWSDNVPINPDTGLPWPYINGVSISNDGVEYLGQGTICYQPLWIDALTEDNAGDSGMLVKFFDTRWRLHSLALPAKALHARAGDLGEFFANKQCFFVPGKEKWMQRALAANAVQCTRYLQSTSRLGWFSNRESQGIFVLPRTVLGNTEEEIVYQSDIPLSYAETLHGRGKLKEWQSHVAAPCQGNPVLMFALLCGLAGPLMKLCEVEGGGFHLYGLTTGGKTTAAQVAISPWGCAADPGEDSSLTAVRTWDVTGNALEGLAELHNHMILVLDEIGKYPDKDLGRLIYKLSHGKGKERATISGGLRSPRAWKVFIFSTGELSTVQKAAEYGETLKGGQLSRLPDIPADSSSDGSRSVVVDPHGEDPKEFVEKLKAGCTRYYGTAGPTLVSYLIAWSDKLHSDDNGGLATLSGDLRGRLKQLEEWLNADERLPEEGRRVIRRFALVALAGWLGYEAGIIPWQLEYTLEAVKDVRDRWLAEQGSNRSEIDRGLARLRDQLVRNIGRFKGVDAAPASTDKELLGFRVDDFFLITDEGMQELCRGYDFKVILKVLSKQGFLWETDSPSRKGLKRKAPKIKAYGQYRPWVYWLSLRFIGDVVDGESEEDIALREIEEGMV